jgi:heme/copper-type cytochrome/quinol oxidase subunit 1
MKHKAHMYFWITTILIVFAGGVEHLLFGDTTLDLNVHDTYYVIDHLYVVILLTLVYFTLGLGYYVLYKIGISLNKKLTKVHTVVTVLAVPAYYSLCSYYAIINAADPMTISNYGALNTELVIIFFAVLLIQPLYFINIIVSLIKRKKA